MIRKPLSGTFEPKTLTLWPAPDGLNKSTIGHHDLKDNKMNSCSSAGAASCDGSRRVHRQRYKHAHAPIRGDTAVDVSTISDLVKHWIPRQTQGLSII